MMEEEIKNTYDCSKCHVDCSTGENRNSYDRIGFCSSCHDIFKPASNSTWDNSSWRLANS